MPVLFVYGTLKRGLRNHRLIADQQFLQIATTAPQYAVADFGVHPGLLAGPWAVLGELWRVSDCCLGELDDFEGHPEHFERRAIDISGFDGVVEAYFFNRPIAPGTPLAAQWPIQRPSTSAML
jgi:gamma-glutamylaminecyclotransferase